MHENHNLCAKTITKTDQVQRKYINRLREGVKYYFADFVRKGGGGTPQIRNPLFAEIFSVKGGGGGYPQIRSLFFGPKSGVSEQKTYFLTLF